MDSYVELLTTDLENVHGLMFPVYEANAMYISVNIEHDSFSKHYLWIL